MKDTIGKSVSYSLNAALAEARAMAVGHAAEGEYVYTVTIKRSMSIDEWFTLLASVPVDERVPWLQRYSVRRLRHAADQQGAGDVGYLTKKQCIDYIMENF